MTTKLMTHSTPVDRVATRVVGAKGTWWEPQICRGEPYWDVPPEIMKIPASFNVQPQFVDFTGWALGRLTIMGLCAHARDEAKTTRWVARCDCGSYVLRSGKAIKAQKNKDECCPRCQAKRKIQREPGR